MNSASVFHKNKYVFFESYTKYSSIASEGLFLTTLPIKVLRLNRLLGLWVLVLIEVCWSTSLSFSLTFQRFCCRAESYITNWICGGIILKVILLKDFFCLYIFLKRNTRYNKKDLDGIVVVHELTSVCWQISHLSIKRDHALTFDISFPFYYSVRLLKFVPDRSYYHKLSISSTYMMMWGLTLT